MPVLLDALARTLPELLLVSIAGRVLLAWLPPGRIGSHDPAALPLCWAASWVLGGIAATACALVAGAVGGAGAPPGGRALLAAVALVLGGVRLATRPAAMVPRHEVAPEPLSWPARLAGAALVAALSWRLLALPWDPAVLECSTSEHEHAGGRCPVAAAGLVSAWLHLVALAILAAHGLERARRARLERRLLVLAFVLLSFAALPDRAALAAGAGAALAIPWWRRADRRALALAAIAFAGAGMTDDAGHAHVASPSAGAWDSAWLAAGTIALWIASARPSRPTALFWCLGALLLLLTNAAAPAELARATSEPTLALALGMAFGPSPAVALFWTAAAAAALASVLGIRGGFRARAEAAGTSGRAAIDPPAREIAGLLLVLACSFLAALLPIGNHPEHVASVSPRLWPAALCLIGLVFLRAERTPAR